MDIGEAIKPLKDFTKNSVRLVKRCTKPDRKGGDWAHAEEEVAKGTSGTLPLSARCACCGAEFMKVCSRTAVGFIVMGFIGFFVKLLFIVSCARPDDARRAVVMMVIWRPGAALLTPPPVSRPLV